MAGRWGTGGMDFLEVQATRNGNMGDIYPLVNEEINSLRTWTWPIESHRNRWIYMDLPIEHGDFPVRYVTVYQRVYPLR